MQSNELYDLMIRKGYPAGFASIVAEQMHTEYTSERMIRYISRCPLLPPQEVADEMLAILADRDGLVRKHISQHAQSKVNEMYRSSIFEDPLEYTIREIRAAEYGLLRDFLYEAIFVPEGCEAPDRSILDLPDLQVYIKDFGSRPSDKCLLADVDGRPVGSVWCRIMEDYGHIDDATPSLAIALFKEYRGLGIGTALMQRMMSLLCGSGFTRVSLSVQKNNRAVRLYRRLGFTTVKMTDEEFIMAAET